MGSGGDCGIVLRHALAEARDLWRIARTNQEGVKAAAKKMGLCPRQCGGVMRLLVAFGGIPSRERLATVVMRDPGLMDEDVAEMFGMSVRWAASVRSRIEELRAAEPVPERYEFVDEGLRPGDPTPYEIAKRAEAIRAAWPPNYRGADLPGFFKALALPGMRHFCWQGRHASFVQVRIAKWASG